MVKSIKISVKGKKVFINALAYRNMFQQARGLMFSVKKNILFIFKKERYIQLHMWFVFFPIWAFFIDSKGKIVERKFLHPFQIYFARCKARYVLEVPNEDLGNKISVGDTLLWKPASNKL
ncbi:MAG: DUF192 domain-containing protein [Candidatus Woesearchaeota archaeon]